MHMTGLNRKCPSDHLRHHNASDSRAIERLTPSADERLHRFRERRSGVEVREVVLQTPAQVIRGIIS